MSPEMGPEMVSSGESLRTQGALKSYGMLLCIFQACRFILTLSNEIYHQVRTSNTLDKHINNQTSHLGVGLSCLQSLMKNTRQRET